MNPIKKAIGKKKGTTLHYESNSGDKFHIKNPTWKGKLFKGKTGREYKD